MVHYTIRLKASIDQIHWKTLHAKLLKRLLLLCTLFILKSLIYIKVFLSDVMVQ